MNTNLSRQQIAAAIRNGQPLTAAQSARVEHIRQLVEARADVHNPSFIACVHKTPYQRFKSLKRKTQSLLPFPKHVARCLRYGLRKLVGMCR